MHRVGHFSRDAGVQSRMQRQVASASTNVAIEIDKLRLGRVADNRVAALPADIQVDVFCPSRTCL